MTDFSKAMTPEQILEAAREDGYELSDEELEGIAGGGEWKNECCPNCGHTGTMYNPGTGVSRCGKCGTTW
jgi:ribosomal protein S27AE